MRHPEPLLPDGRKRFVGRSDPPLSAAGIEHAHRLADRFRSLGLESIHSSDLRRCMTAAEIIAGAACRESGARGREERCDLCPSVQPEPRLREIDAGLWEFLTFDEVRRLYPQEYAERERDLVGYRFPGGESFRDLRERVVPAFLDIIDHGGEKILVVAHQGVNRVLICEVLGLPLEGLFSIEQEHGCITLIRSYRVPAGGRRMEVLE